MQLHKLRRKRLQTLIQSIQDHLALFQPASEKGQKMRGVGIFSAVEGFAYGIEGLGY